jgi:hypothetical protein
MAEFDPDKFLAEDNVAESKSFDPDKFLSETDPDVKKKDRPNRLRTLLYKVLEVLRKSLHNLLRMG